MTKPIFKILSTLVWLCLCAAGGVLLVTGSLYLYLSPKLPSVESLREIKLQTPLRIYSQDLQLIGEFGEMRRNPITFDQIPTSYIQALLSAEDDHFYQHSGVDIGGLMRAASQLVTSGEIKTGGSTITMQVARNFFLTHKQTFTRKFNEILLALRIEDELSKDEILTLYANKIYQGNRAYGIEAAAQVYYGKPIGELNLAQQAMLAGLPKAPSAYNPIANPNRALIRRNWILKRMLDLGYIDQDTYANTVKEPVTASYHGYTTELDAPYVAEMARMEMLDRVGTAAYTDGYRIYTTINSQLQRTAQLAVQAGLLAYDARHGYRGPEKREVAQSEWENLLRQTPTLGGLVPAMVTETTAQSLKVLLPSGEQAEINWEQGLKGLRKFNSPNSRSAPIQSTEEIFAKGDLIRLQQKEGFWQLSQLPKAQAALVALNPDNGAIQSLAGGFDFRQSHFNRVTQAERQPGSNFKPFIYTTALENGFTPASIINDAPVVFEDDLLESSWRPENDSGKFYGPTRLREALYLSRNLISIRILRSLGIDKALSGLERFGFDPTSLPNNLSLALGSHAVTPLQIATGYASFANGGYRVAPFLIARIEDSVGNVLYNAEPLTVCRQCSDTAPEQSTFDATEEVAGAPDTALTDGIGGSDKPLELRPELPKAPRIIDERTAYIIDSILKDVIRKGTGRKAQVLKRTDIAGKTGTTNGPRDAWFSGYSTHMVTTTWVGFDENQLLGRSEYGGSAALPIWIDFMRAALAGKPQFIRPQPEGIVMARIDPTTGLSVGPEHRNAIFEIFRKEDVPPMAEFSSPGGAGGQTGPVPEDLF
ncbi:MAG: penicillin-binding protein 1A [Porticoccaceae bacterium]